MWVIAIREIFFYMDILLYYTRRKFYRVQIMKNAFPFIKFIVKLEYITMLRYLLV